MEYIFTAAGVIGEVSPAQLYKRYNCQSGGAANSNGMFPREWGCMAFSDPGKQTHTLLSCRSRSDNKCSQVIGPKDLTLGFL